MHTASFKAETPFKHNLYVNNQSLFDPAEQTRLCTSPNHCLIVWFILHGNSLDLIYLVNGLVHTGRPFKKQPEMQK